MGLRKVENIVTYFIFVSRPNVVITFCQLTFLYVTRRLLLAHSFLWVLVVDVTLLMLLIGTFPTLMLRPYKTKYTAFSLCSNFSSNYDFLGMYYPQQG